MKEIIMLLDNAFNPDMRVYKEAKYLVDKGINVEIVCLDKKNEFIDKPYEIVDGIKIKRIFCRNQKITNLMEKYRIVNMLKKIIYIIWFLDFLFKLKKYLKDKSFEILHCHDLIMAFCGTILFRKKDIVFDMHEYYGDNKNKFIDSIIKKAVKYTQNKSKWIIGVNSFQKKYISEKNINKFIEIPNYPIKQTFNNIEKTKSEKIRISYVGTVRDYESLKSLIDLDLSKEKFEIKIYGIGSAYEELLKYAKIKNKEEIIVGKFDGRRDAEVIYSNTDILFSVFNPNSRDWKNWKNAMPIKSYEAIITLTPIIATENTVLGDFVIEYDIGYCIKPQKNNIQELLSNITREDLKIKENNLRKIQNNYTWENVVKNMKKIYNIL